MDLLTSVEPQLALPVVGVVLCALLVYIFGFQKTQEPSFQHLALLQATSKGSRAASTGLRQRSTTPQVKGGGGVVGGKGKSVVNGGNVLSPSVPTTSGTQEKASPKPNGVLKTAKSNNTKDGSNKENVRPPKSTPKKEKIPREAAEDLNSGDWIQAPSRKVKQDKKSKTEKTKKDVKQSGIVSGSGNNVPAATSGSDEDWDFPVLKDVSALQGFIPKPQEEKAGLVERSQESASEPQAKEVAETASSPATPKAVAAKPKKAGKTPVSSIPSSVESSPKKSNAKEEVALVQNVEAEVKGKKPVVEVKENPSHVKKADVPSSKAKDEETSQNDPRNNIAFDEMGDTWEEAKSRGTKKRRARKD